MATFGLVHGAWHDGWCWHRLREELTGRGHSAVAPDLPAGDPAAGAGDYAAVVAAALEGAGDDVVLVGHSLGGLTIPVVAQLRPVRHLVFLCALLPRPGLSLGQQTRAEAVVAEGFGAGQIRHPDGSTSWRPPAARRLFYHDCPADLAEAAVGRLRRQAWTIADEVSPLAAWPAVPATSVLCRDDRVIRPEWSRRAARDRLGTDARELDGGHSPFLARPGEVAALLDAVAAHPAGP